MHTHGGEAANCCTGICVYETRFVVAGLKVGASEDHRSSRGPGLKQLTWRDVFQLVFSPQNFSSLRFFRGFFP